MEAVDSVVIVRDVVSCPNRAAGSGPGTVFPPSPPYPPSRGGGGGGGDGGGGVLRESWAAAAIAFLSLGWAGTLLGLLRVYALLRRERGLEDMMGMGVVMSTQPGAGGGGRRHVILQEDVDDVEL